MPPPGRSRVTIGDLAIFIAFSACCLAPWLAQGPAEMTRYFLAHGLLSCGTIALFVLNRRLSRWTWLILTSWCVKPVGDLAREMGLGHGLGLNDPFGLPGMTESMLSAAMHFVGLAFLFRDIRRRLVAPESPRLQPDNLPIRPPDGDAAPADVS